MLHYYAPLQPLVNSDVANEEAFTSSRLAEMPSRLPTAIEEFVRQLVKTRPLKRRASGLALFCVRFGLGKQSSVPGNAVLYAPSDYAAAARLLSDRGLPLEKVHSTARSSELVAAARMGGGEMPSGVSFFALTVDAVRSWPHEVLVACDSVAALRAASQDHLLSQEIRGRQALSFFVGGVAGFSKTAARSILVHSDKPTIAYTKRSKEAAIGWTRTLPRLEALCIASR